MNLELAIYVTTFALISASLLMISGKRGPRGAAAREREHAEALDALVRPMLLFTTTAPVAHC
jgi:hypothetical protein